MKITDNYTYDLTKQPKDPNKPNGSMRPVKPDPSTYIVEIIGVYKDGVRYRGYKSYLIIENMASKKFDHNFEKLKEEAIKKCQDKKICQKCGNCELASRINHLENKCEAAKITRPKYRAGLLTVLKKALRFIENENSRRNKFQYKLELHKIKYTNGQTLSLGMAYRKMTYRKARKPKAKFKTKKEFNTESKFSAKNRAKTLLELKSKS